MKHNRMLGLLMAVGVAAFTACNNDSTSSANGDSTTAVTPTPADNTSAASSSGDYSAYADQIEKNSASGRYVNPKTGQKYSKLTVNRQTGEITDENNEPVWRYVDTEDWWVYGLDDNDWTWKQMGHAKMNDSNHELTYQDDSGNWVNYDKMYKSDDESMAKTWKTKSGDTKIKFGKDGDIKVKDESGKVKYDADDNKVKTDTTK